MSGRTIILLVVHLCLYCPLQAQVGILSLPNAGIEIAHVNPARVSLVNNDWDVQIFASSMTGQTNHAFLRNESLLNLGKELLKKGELVHRFQTRIIPKLDYYDSRKSTFVKGHFRIAGPSFTLKVGKWHMGLLSGVNLAASAISIPSNLGYYNNYAIPLGTEYDLDGGQGAGLLWTDIGIHFSRTWNIHKRKSISWGMNLKYLSSYYGVAIKNSGTSVARKLGGGRIAAVSGKGEVLLSDSWRFETPFAIHNTGNGFGMDVSMIVKSQSSIYSNPIEWGIALSDIGMLQLSKETSRSATVEVQNEIEFSAASFKESGFHPQASFSTFNQMVLSKGNMVEENPGSIFYTPARINAYFSSPLTKRIQGQITWQQSLLWDYRTSVAMNYMAVSATYHNNQFSLSLPVTFLNYRHVWTGITLRMGPLTIGTDRLFGTIIPHKRLDGAAFYFGVKLDHLSFPFKTAKWSRKRVKCPMY